MMRAYAFGNGYIGFTEGAVPDGALILAWGPSGLVEQTVRGLARRGYDNETYLVPGIPEAQNETEAYAAFRTFFDRVQLQLGRHGVGTPPAQETRRGKKGERSC